MKKDEAEEAIRHLCREWGNEVGIAPDPSVMPSFSDFYRWVQDKHPDCLEFRSSISVIHDVEQWFDEEFKQTWRN